MMQRMLQRSRGRNNDLVNAAKEARSIFVIH
jgi:hypothetical protein